MLKIQKAIGEKFGMLFFAIMILVAGFAVGLFKGWQFSLSLLVIFPVFGIGFGLSIQQ